MALPQHNVLRNVWTIGLLEDNIEAYDTSVDEFIRRGGRNVSISCPAGAIERSATLVALFKMMRDRPIINEEARRQREAFRRREEETRRAIARAGDAERERLEAEAEAAREAEERRRREAELEAERLRDEERARQEAETAREALASQKRGPKRAGRHGDSELLKSRYDKVQDWFGEYVRKDDADDYGEFKPHKVKEFFDRKIADNRSPDVGDHVFHNENHEWDGSIRRYIADSGEEALGFEPGTKWGQTEAEYNAAKKNNGGNNNNNNNAGNNNNNNNSGTRRNNNNNNSGTRRNNNNNSGTRRNNNNNSGNNNVPNSPRTARRKRAAAAEARFAKRQRKGGKKRKKTRGKRVKKKGKKTRHGRKK